MPHQPDSWPAGCLPRMMDVKFAAYYCGISPTAFLTRVKAGLLPPGRRDGKRVLWDLVTVNRALDRLSGVITDDSVDSLIDHDEAQAFAAMVARGERDRKLEERIFAAHLAGKTSREIGAREKLSPQKVASIIRWHKGRKPSAPISSR